jgi:hypothetical protein
METISVHPSGCDMASAYKHFFYMKLGIRVLYKELLSKHELREVRLCDGHILLQNAESFI